MARVLIIGAGGAGRVAAHKCVEASHAFSEVCLASRRKHKCDEIAAQLPDTIQTAGLDAGDQQQVEDLIQEFGPDVVIHLALPYQNIPIMEACLNTGAHYLDTALAEEPENPDAFYDEQWSYHERFREAGITGLLGCGFDPGVTNMFSAYADKHLFDRIISIDILDCNSGKTGLPFATNFNPEINLRELTLPGRYYENGIFVETPPLSVCRTFDFPQIGPRRIYLMWHEEIESLVANIAGIERIRFWMTFTDSYLEHLRVFENIGLTRTDAVDFHGREIVPLQFLKTLLPDPGSLGPLTTGKTCIGCLVRGIRDGAERIVFLFNVCDHEACNAEVGSQAISYTTGVPAAVGAMLMTRDDWAPPGIYNVEQLDPDPFLSRLGRFGLPWECLDLNGGL